MTTEAGIVQRYWRMYGGFTAVLKSRYFLASIIFTIVLYPHWSQPGWWEDVLNIMPNLLGFSLGGFAMWMSIGDDSFRELICGEESVGETSPYMEVNATFVHFILLQLLSIGVAITAKAYYFPLPADNMFIVVLGELFYPLAMAGFFLGYLVFIYALFSAAAATFALMRVSSWYDMQQTRQKLIKAATATRVDAPGGQSVQND